MKMSKLIVISVLSVVFAAGLAIAGSSTNVIDVKESTNISDEKSVAITGVSVNAGDGTAQNTVGADTVINKAEDNAVAISNSALNLGDGTTTNEVKDASIITNTAKNKSVSISNTSINLSGSGGGQMGKLGGK